MITCFHLFDNDFEINLFVFRDQTSNAIDSKDYITEALNQQKSGFDEEVTALDTKSIAGIDATDRIAHRNSSLN